MSTGLPTVILTRLPFAERLRFEAEVLHPLQSDPMSAGNAPRASFGIELVGEPFTDGVYASTGMKLRLENGDVVSRALKPPSGCQRGQSCAKDCAPLGTPLALRHILCQRLDWIRREVQDRLVSGSQDPQVSPNQTKRQ